MNNTNSLYDKDIYAWSLDQANHLKNKEVDMLDWDHLIEEIESLGRSAKHALKNHFKNLLMHKLKIQYQPQKHTRSWDTSIALAKIEIEDELNENPSLKYELNNLFLNSYRKAKIVASGETGIDIKKFPQECPWTIEEILGDEK